MATKSRRLLGKVTKSGITVEFKKCRKCMEEKRPVEFYDAVDPFIDSDGLFSICKPCCNSIFDTYFESEKSMELALLRFCRSVNLKYSEEAIQAALAHMAHKSIYT